MLFLSNGVNKAELRDVSISMLLENVEETLIWVQIGNHLFLFGFFKYRYYCKHKKTSLL